MSCRRRGRSGFQAPPGRVAWTPNDLRRAGVPRDSLPGRDREEALSNSLSALSAVASRQPGTVAISEPTTVGTVDESMKRFDPDGRAALRHGLRDLPR